MTATSERPLPNPSAASVPTGATRAQQRLRQILDEINDLVIVGRFDHGIMYLNAVAARALGPMLPGARLLDHLAEHTRDFVLTEVMPVLERGERWIGEIPITVEGQEVILATTATPVLEDDALYYGVIMHDVTEARHQAKELHDQARRDPLTGLPNRLALMELLHDLREAGADAGAKTVSVCFVDLDNLKVVNDGLGHSAGDRLLQAVGLELLGLPDHMVARFGGDEFVVVHLDHTPEDAVRSAEMVRAGIETVRVAGVANHVSASIGVASCPVVDFDPESLLRDADAAMYVAKRNGRSRIVHFDESMRAVVARRFDLERQLRQALAHDDLSLHYQPVVHIGTGAVTGFEALSRWPAATPDEFIPMAEECGLIVPLGRWALRESLRTLRRLDAVTGSTTADLAPRRTMAVNVSAHQLFEPSFPTTVLEVLDETGITPCRLVLELTESVLIHPSEEIDNALHELHAAGVRLALDDFGSGYSSIGYLRRYPISILKLDTGYTQNLDDPPTRIIAEAMVAMGLQLGLEVVAEGVETKEQWAAVAELGITSAQGYLLGAAMPASELPARLRAP